MPGFTYSKSADPDLLNVSLRHPEYEIGQMRKVAGIWQYRLKPEDLWTNGGTIKYLCAEALLSAYGPVSGSN
jgi:hypothetical protein